MRSIPLGPFDLFEPIGRGGMGEVWRGVHRAQEVPVAVKVLTARSLRRSFFLSAFRNEVRAMAGLDHPSIALVFDYGEVSEEASRRSQGRLVADSPYLAMELAHGGSLAPWCGRLRWAEVREILRGLLDALAHAHARGVVHRDLKPANVLLGSERDLRPGIKLTDFGLAHLVELAERPAPRGPTAGTPQYMAPEQVHGGRRDYGPWTDLFSLGRVALALVYGSPSPTEEQHAAAPALPKGFDAWVVRLLQPEPENRFQRAADAALALLALPELDEKAEQAHRRDGPLLGISAETFALTGVDSTVSRVGNTPARSRDTGVSRDTGSGPRGAVSPDSDTVALADAATPRTGSGLRGEEDEAPSRGAAARSGEGEPCSRAVPPLPASWRRPEPTLSPMRLLGAGLGLFGLRTISLVDREEERDAAWAALGAAREEGRPRALILSGPAGCGKSRLAEWLCERAHEVGSGTVIRVTHAPLPGPADGLPAAVSRQLRCVGLDRHGVLKRLELLLWRQGVRDPDEWHALTELISPATEADLEPGVQAIRFASPTERHVLVVRLLERLCVERPVVVWLDDVQWGMDSLAFTRQLLSTAATGPLPVLVVLTVRQEALVERPAEAGAIQELAERADVARLEIGPLPPEQHAALVRGLLGLEGELAATVEARTAGNPQFAVQLVGDWVHRGLLEPGERGFRLKPGARVDMPDLLHKVWAARVESTLRGRAAAHGVALELAAVLGQEVVGEEWRDAAALEGVDVPWELVDSLLEHRLARVSEGGVETGWAFVHGMIRESLERRARESGRWWAHNRAAAAMLGQRASGKVHPERPTLRLNERLGRHLLAAGDREEALEPLLRGARERMVVGDFAAAALLLGDREQALRDLERPQRDPRWGEGWVTFGRLARLRGRLSEAAGWVSQALESSNRYGWAEIGAQAHWEQGLVYWNTGEPDRAMTFLDRAEEMASKSDDRRLIAEVRRDLGYVQLRRGDLDAALRCFKLAQGDFQRIGDAVGEAYILLGMAERASSRGDNAEARRCYEAALVGFERAGARKGVADTLNLLGEQARLEGDLALAEERYRASFQRFRAIGSAMSVAPECNLGLVLVERDRFAEARRTLESVLQTLEREGLQIYQGNVHAYLLPCVAVGEDWPDFEHHVALASTILEQQGVVDEDVARLAAQAGDVARASGQSAAARSAYELALRQRRALGQAREEQLLVSALDSLKR